MYPKNKDFIFTIFDDTDVSTLENIKPVYDFLYSIGMLTTKSVWPLSCNNTNSWYYGSDSLQDPEYTEYIKELSKRGFEIGFHGATMVSSKRSKTLKAIEEFNEKLGFYPRIYASHSSNFENMNWGYKRFSSKLIGNLYKLISQDKKEYLGGNKSSDYYWEDFAKKHIDYVRNFTFDTINLLDITRFICYSSSHFPDINNWFITSDADNVQAFNKLILIKNQKILERKKGICVISTHFGKGFVRKGELNQKTKELLLELSKRNGWFVPVSQVFDFWKGVNSLDADIPRYELFKIELRWVLHCIIRHFNKTNYLMTEKNYLQKGSQITTSIGNGIHLSKK